MGVSPNELKWRTKKVSIFVILSTWGNLSDPLRIQTG